VKSKLEDTKDLYNKFYEESGNPESTLAIARIYINLLEGEIKRLKECKDIDISDYNKTVKAHYEDQKKPYEVK
jgi:hypothetical protein